MTIGYITSRFPKLTETFVLYEIVAMERHGVATTLYPLLLEKQKVVHPEVESLNGRVVFHPFVSPAILAAVAHFARRRPGALWGALAEVLRGTWGSANFFVGAIGIFPKAVRMAYEMERKGVTHVHAHFANHPTVAALIVHRLTGIPFSFTAHGHDIHVERRMLREKVDAAAFAVMISEYNRRLVLDECPGTDAAKLRVLHCGADTALFAPEERPEDHGTLSIVCVGSFIEVKGHRHLVEACRLLRTRGTRVHCHLVGDGPGREALVAQVADAGLGGEVTLHGPLARPAVASLLRRCDVIVQPSVPTRRGSREGIPVSVMEGMACGLPAVASRISGIPELVDDGVNGFLVPPADPESLAGALEKLAHDPERRRRMGRAARAKVLESFDLSRNAARLADLIREVPRTAIPARAFGVSRREARA
ncbi:MAG TPA: glycosyltransferase [Candidatus Eisenbacteria bacterium]|nr:glycosyltransferase [Candidatus Eisenbacteria bacterium]